MQIVNAVLGLFSPWMWFLAVVVAVAFIGSRMKVPFLVSLWLELLSVGATLWTQAKGNALVLGIAAVLFFVDQRLFTILLITVAVVVAVGNKVNDIVATLKLPKA